MKTKRSIMKKNLLTILAAAAFSFALPHLLMAEPVMDSEEQEEKTDRVEEALQLLRSEENSQQVAGMRLLQEEVDRGNVEAMVNLGAAYLRGAGGGEVSESAALEMWEKAAAAGSSRGRLNLGILLRQANTIPRDPERSLQEIQAAAETNLVEAHSVLGRLLFNGDQYQEQDFSAAFPHLLVAAEQGDAVCQNMVGVAWRDGRGTHVDPEAARDWFEKSARQNHSKAQANLARIMGVEIPGSPERAKALFWLIVAKEQAEPTAIRTFNELMITFSPAELSRAQREAETFLLQQKMSAKASIAE
jgi:TPR repeat protein